MEIVAILIVAAVVFTLCFLLDKGFTKTFRGQEEHKSGLSVRVNKRYGSMGLIVAIMGIAALFTEGWLMFAGGCLLLLTGTGLVVYYMTFGVFYDADTFVLTTFGKKSATYRYDEIKSQQLFSSYGNLVVDLNMVDGRSVQLQSKMTGVYEFLDHASAAWMRQNGLEKENCEFYDPQNSCWFPPMEG